jgi:hypothetical protein
MKQQKVRKPTMLEAHAQSIERNHAYQSSSRITSRLIVLACEIGELEREIVALQMAAANAKAKRLQLTASMAGYQAILDKR